MESKKRWLGHSCGKSQLQQLRRAVFNSREIFVCWECEFSHSFHSVLGRGMGCQCPFAQKWDTITQQARDSCFAQLIGRTKSTFPKVTTVSTQLMVARPIHKATGLVLYTTPDCPDETNWLKHFLQRNGCTYMELDGNDVGTCATETSKRCRSCNAVCLTFVTRVLSSIAQSARKAIWKECDSPGYCLGRLHLDSFRRRESS
jgi:hypothetical protein